MSAPPCGSGDCPVAVPTRDRLRRVRTVVEPAGTLLWRGFRRRHPAAELVPGVGDTRFAPLPGTQHAYVSASRTAALLESALHEVAAPEPTIFLAGLSAWSLAPVALMADVRLFDLRDGELDRLGMTGSELVDTAAEHYACTRRWAAALHHRQVGSHRPVGAIWHSRQADLHASAQSGGLAADLLIHRTVEAAVVWSPPAPTRLLALAGDVEPLVRAGRPVRLVQELAALLSAPIM